MTTWARANVCFSAGIVGATEEGFPSASKTSTLCVTCRLITDAPTPSRNSPSRAIGTAKSTPVFASMLRVRSTGRLLGPRSSKPS
jgi:hypothetical protein